MGRDYHYFTRSSTWDYSNEVDSMIEIVIAVALVGGFIMGWLVGILNS